jgi:hypothetical protein
LADTAGADQIAVQLVGAGFEDMLVEQHIIVAELAGVEYMLDVHRVGVEVAEEESRLAAELAEGAHMPEEYTSEVEYMIAEAEHTMEELERA